MPARWLMDLFDGISGNRGYLAVGSVVAAYLAAFGLIETKSLQEETRASVERSLFITLVSSGNAASFVAAMKWFGPVQTMVATRPPLLSKPREWFQPPNQPNRIPMWEWARSRLGSCSKEIKDCSLTGETRLDLRNAYLKGADLDVVNLWDAKLNAADLYGAHLQLADLQHADLSGAYLRNADLTFAGLQQADLTGADLTDADLTSADLTGANLTRADLSGANLGSTNLFSVNLTAARDRRSRC